MFSIPTARHTYGPWRDGRLVSRHRARVRKAVLHTEAVDLSDYVISLMVS